MPYALHPEAVEDLDEILEFIGNLNSSAADRLLDEFFAAFDLLASMPNQGFRRPELTSRPLRFTLVRNYLIAYTPEQAPLWIVTVIDGRRNPRVIAAILRRRE
ncbi:MAG: type II toxin-antitoxin system RelE/ParE family toxin [Bryobacteraceae bacterium]